MMWRVSKLGAQAECCQVPSTCLITLSMRFSSRPYCPLGRVGLTISALTLRDLS